MGLEPELNVFGSLLHMHLLGIGARLHHYRDGVEKPYLAEDMTYDFNYQEQSRRDPEMKIMKVISKRYATDI